MKAQAPRRVPGGDDHAPLRSAEPDPLAVGETAGDVARPEGKLAGDQIPEERFVIGPRDAVPVEENVLRLKGGGGLLPRPNLPPGEPVEKKEGVPGGEG